MLIVKDLAMAYGPKLLFAEANLTLNSKKRYGLVGANGVGKTTFLKLIAGDEEELDGQLIKEKRARVGMLKQDQFRFENVSIINTVIAGKNELYSAMCEKEELLSREDFDDQAGFRLGELEQIVMDNDGYNAEYVAAELLVGLGIKEEYHYQPLSTLSGGYKLRVLLAQSLFDNPDILLLDEPTNHLDMDSIYWLENYLKESFDGLLIFISHDISFINNIATHILDIDYGEIRQYTGNYNQFVEQKQQVIEIKMHEMAYMQKKIEKLQGFVDKFRAGTRSRQAKSREKQLDKLELPEIGKSSRVSPCFNFQQKRPSGKVVLTVKAIEKSFAERKLLHNVSFTITKGEKVIIIGPNGVGKSTLLKILLDRIIADQGTHEWGYETQVSYFAQDHHDLLNQHINALEWLESQTSNLTTNEMRSVLGQVLFRQDEVLKDILSISGGEGARLLLAKMMLEQGNVIVLDEPTNHLDIESKEALKKALIKFPGTVMLVTHDRDFASSIATRIIAITEKKVIDFKGSYAEYLSKHGKDYYKPQ